MTTKLVRIWPKSPQSWDTLHQYFKYFRRLFKSSEESRVSSKFIDCDMMLAGILLSSRAGAAATAPETSGSTWPDSQKYVEYCRIQEPPQQHRINTAVPRIGESIRFISAVTEDHCRYLQMTPWCTCRLNMRTAWSLWMTCKESAGGPSEDHYRSSLEGEILSHRSEWMECRILYLHIFAPNSWWSWCRCKLATGNGVPEANLCSAQTLTLWTQAALHKYFRHEIWNREYLGLHCLLPKPVDFDFGEEVPGIIFCTKFASITFRVGGFCWWNSIVNLQAASCEKKQTRSKTEKDFQSMQECPLTSQKETVVLKTACFSPNQYSLPVPPVKAKTCLAAEIAGKAASVAGTSLKWIWTECRRIWPLLNCFAEL